MLVLATALWAVALIAPLLLSGYSPIEITLSRFFFYGAASTGILVSRYRGRSLSRTLWCRAAAYALAGNILVSVLVSFGVQDTGAEIAVPINGLLPICVSLAGSHSLPREKWQRLILPFALLALGLCIVLLVRKNDDMQVARLSWQGVAAVAASVLLWTWYAISNERFLRRNPSISGAHWSSAIGAMTLFIAFVMAVADVAFMETSVEALKTQATERSVLPFLIVTLTLGVGTSWLATSLFNYASHSLPMGLVGQFLTIETLFGIAYTCIYHQVLPSPSQTAGSMLVILGIWLSSRVLLR